MPPKKPQKTTERPSSRGALSDSGRREAQALDKPKVFYEPRATPRPTTYSVAQAQVTMHAETYTGPLPPPAILKQYDEIVPGSAAQMMADQHAQTVHRIDLERRTIYNDILMSRAGLVAGLIVALAFGYLSYLLIMAGHDIPGTILGTGDLGALVGTFVYVGTNRRKEREEKARVMASNAPPANPK